MARSLHFLCIEWLYQQVLIGFYRNYSEGNFKMSLRDLIHCPPELVAHKDVVQFVSWKIIPLYFDDKNGNEFLSFEVQKDMQEKMHYHLFTKLVVSFARKKLSLPLETHDGTEHVLDVRAMQFQAIGKVQQLESRSVKLLSMLTTHTKILKVGFVLLFIV